MTVQFWLLLIAVPLLLGEFTELSPWLAGKILRFSAWLLPDSCAAERFREEWEAELARVPGKIFKLGYAVLRLALVPLTWVEVNLDAKQRRQGEAASQARNEASRLQLQPSPTAPPAEFMGIEFRQIKRVTLPRDGEGFCIEQKNGTKTWMPESQYSKFDQAYVAHHRFRQSGEHAAETDS